MSWNNYVSRGDSIFDKIFVFIGNLAVVSFNKITSLEKSNRLDEYFNDYRKREREERLFREILLKEENDSKNIIEKIRKAIIENINAKIMAILILFTVITGMMFGIEYLVIMFMLISMFLATAIYYPKIESRRKYNDLNLELPYALRHMGTELKSGKGLYDSLATIADSNYGSLSEEFRRVLEEIKYGTSNEESLMNMSKRVKSEGLKRATQQIITTLRVGGNLASSLNIIAEDISFDMQIKLKEYSQKLNGFILIYTFIAILGPVILLIMLMAASTVMGDIVPGNLILIAYVFFFPMVVVFLGLLIQKLEPKI